MKRGWFLFLVLVSLVSMANADIKVENLNPNGITWWGSSTLYEFNTGTVEIYFKTLNSDLLEVNVTLTGATINEILNPSNKCQVINGNKINCTGDFDILSVNITGAGVDANTNFDWNIDAVDSESGSVTKTLQLTVLNDLIAPSIVLNGPEEGAVVKEVFLNFTPNDEVSEELNCSLYLNNSYNQTKINLTRGKESNFTVNLSDGNYNWSVSCRDKAGNANQSGIKKIIVDITAPGITLDLPTNGTNTQGIVNFSYKVEEPHLANCSLYIDSGLIETKLNNSNFTNINLTASNNFYQWQVECGDFVGNKGTSLVWKVYYDNVFPVITNVTNSSITYNSAKIAWQANETSNNTIYYSLNISDLSLIKTGDSLTASPEITLSSLSASSTYFYLVGSCDYFNNCQNSTTTFNFTIDSAPANPSSEGGGGGGGGSSVTKEIKAIAETPCTEDWNCGDWSGCLDGTQTRNCIDSHDCSTETLKPKTARTCQSLSSSEKVTNMETTNPVSAAPEGTGNGNIITGSTVVGGFFSNIRGSTLALIVIILVILALIAWKLILNHKKKKRLGASGSSEISITIRPKE